MSQTKFRIDSQLPEKNLLHSRKAQAPPIRYTGESVVASVAGLSPCSGAAAAGA
jgi:hypothetical protein